VLDHLVQDRALGLAAAVVCRPVAVTDRGVVPDGDRAAADHGPAAIPRSVPDSRGCDLGSLSPRASGIRTKESGSRTIVRIPDSPAEPQAAPPVLQILYAWSMGSKLRRWHIVTSQRGHRGRRSPRRNALARVIRISKDRKPTRRAASVSSRRTRRS